MPEYTWDHVHLRTPDPEGTAQWFERVLGAEVIRTQQQGETRIDLKLGGANIFNQFPSKQNPDETDNGFKYEAVQFGLNGAAWFARLAVKF